MQEQVAQGLSETELSWIENLKSEEYGQRHLFDILEKVEDISGVIQQLISFDSSYCGGLLSYLRKARKLLKSEDWDNKSPTEFHIRHPPGRSLQVGTTEFEKYELAGLAELKNVAFVLVAGGMGERLDFLGIKLAMPVELVTETSYVELYVKTILACQDLIHETLGVECKLPLAIMTSSKTHRKIAELLKGKNFFGMHEDQISLMEQGEVPAFVDDMASLSIINKDKPTIETKPYGHGQVHELINRHNLAKKWHSEGKKWVFFFQDTNALTFHALSLLIGVSSERSLAMNSLVFERKPGEPVGVVCEIEENNKSLVVNVEYNKLFLLKASKKIQKSDKGTTETLDVEALPGNANIFLLNLKRYCEVLDATGGTLPEFINPKYVDSSRTTLKCTARLECLMQDYSKLLSQHDKVEVTQLERWFCFSTVKNSTASVIGNEYMVSGVSPDCAFSGESDFYYANAKLLEIAALANHCAVQIAPCEPTSFMGVTYKLGPKVVLKPSFGFTFSQIKKKIAPGSILKIHSKATLVMGGQVFLDGLDLNGALKLEGPKNEKLLVRQLTVNNHGWRIQVVGESEEFPQFIRTRGYYLEKLAISELIVNNYY